MITGSGRTRSFLLWAFLISVLIHFILAPIFPHLKSANQQQEVEKVSVTKKIIVKVPTPPPPTPTPKPTTQPITQKQVTHPQPQLKIHPPKLTSKGSGAGVPKYHPPQPGSEQRNPNGQSTPPPAPPSTPGPPASTPPPTPAPPKCKTPYQDATVVQQVTPDYPESARELGLGEVTVQVEVTISPSGSLQSAKLYSQSGNMALDQAALSAAKQSTYAPKVVNCDPIEGTYLFKVTFDPNS